jgi:hypothetical protein
MQLRLCRWLVPVSGEPLATWNLIMQSKSTRANEIFKNVVGAMMVVLILFGILQLLNVIHV